MRQALLMLAIALAPGPATATEPVRNDNYALFMDAWNSREADALAPLAAQFAKAPDIWTRELGLLTEAAAAYRNSNDARCLAMTDSLGRMINADHTLLAFWMHRMRGMSYKRTRAFDQAEEEVNKALELVQGKGRGLLEAGAMISLAELYRATGEHARSMELLQQAEMLAGPVNDEVILCDVYINRGNLYYEQDRFDEAWAMYRTTLDMAARNNLPLLMRNAASNLAAVAYMTDRYDLALNLYDSLDNAMAGTDSHLRAEAIRHAALTSATMGDHRQAIARFERALAMQEVLGDVPGRAKTLQMMSTSLWALGRRDQAVAMSERALSIARSLNDRKLIAEQQLKLHDWYHQRGEVERALVALKEHKVLSDSLDAALFGERIAQLEVRYDTERKERILMQREAELEQEVEVRRHRTTQRNILLVCTALLIVTAVVLYRNVLHRRRLAAQEKQIYEDRIKDQMQRSEVRALNAMMEGQEKERERIAKDLHDRLGSMLSAIKLQFGALEDRVEALQAGQRDQYEKVYGLLDEAVSEVRRISHDMMRGTLARFGLEAALNDLRDSVAVQGRLEVELSLFGLKERMDRNVEIDAYRIVQELVTNALKHARPTEISIALTRTEQELNIVVADNGPGFDPATMAPGAFGIGLSNVRDRARAHGGTVRIDSGHGRGTSINVDIPL